MATCVLPPEADLAQLKRQAKELKSAQHAGDDSANQRVIAVHQVYADASLEAMGQTSLTLTEAQHVIAREFGFESWPKLRRHIETTSPDFERAVEAVIHGDVDMLNELLDQNPNLVNERSAYAHRATLLHYVAANGVEDVRQMAPANGAAVARCLLSRGADVNALCEAYDGGNNGTTLNLLVSSGWPAMAGTTRDIVNVLVDFGCALDGLDNDGAPLGQAIASSARGAAEALAQAGARVDNLIFAAALGDETYLAKHMSGDGSVSAEAASFTSTDGPGGAFGWPFPTRDVRELALLMAALHGRTGCVERLLQWVPVNAAPIRGLTALHMVAMNGSVEMAKQLLQHGADPNQVDEQFGKSSLQMASDYDRAGMVQTLSPS